MSKVSVIIPARFETSPAIDGLTVLQKTVQDVLTHAGGDIEVVVAFDGPPVQTLAKDPRVRVVVHDQPQGIKNTINELAATAKGEYLFKLDGHCSVAPGFDEILQADMEDNWLVMPRFRVLAETTWKLQDDKFWDYFFLCCPLTDPRGFRFKAGGHWSEPTQAKLDILIDETPQFHGSGWFVKRDFFLNRLEGFPNWDPLGHAQEPPNLGLKTWLGPWGSKVMVNKKCWYAHMHKGSGHDRGYRFTHSQNEHSYRITAEYWMFNRWEGRAHDIEWFINKFWPMPTWPEDWQERLAKYAPA